MAPTIEFVQYVRNHVNNQQLESLKEHLAALPVQDVYRGILECPVTLRPVVYRLLNKDIASELFDMMDFPVQADLLESFTSEEALDTLASLEPDDRVHLLDELPARVAKRLLEALPRDQRDITARLMGYEDDTVGRMMSPIYIDVKKNMTVGVAIE